MLCFLQQAVHQKSEKIGEEQIKCQHMADLAMADLGEAMPALEEAMRVFHLTFPAYCISCISMISCQLWLSKMLSSVRILFKSERAEGGNDMCSVFWLFVYLDTP